MKEDTNYILFSILRSVLQENPMSHSDQQMVTKDILPELMEISFQHDIAHLVALGLLNNKLADEKTKQQLQKATFKAVYRYEKLNYERNAVCTALENAKIPFIPLKGSVLQKYYPEPWMRTSCDIDILIHHEDLEKAIQYLTDHLEYAEQGHGSHDVSLFSPSGVHLELHFDLVEDGRANSAKTILNHVWNFAKQRNDFSYFYEMTDEMFYFYHIAHMAKHFETGGCGIRPFIDLWILDKIEGIDQEKRNTLLSQGELLQFAEIVRNLSEIWFGTRCHNSITEKTEKYIIYGGVYGNVENQVKVQQLKKGGKCRYALSKVLLSSKDIKKIYPISEQHRWMVPFMQIRRWLDVMIRGISPGTKRALKSNWDTSNTQAADMKTFLDEIGL